MDILEIIANKRDGKKLSPEEVRFLITGFTRGDIPDYQMAAFLMAYYYQDMVCDNLYPDELAELTTAVANSGVSLDFSDDFEMVFDKHSTGGVGDKLSFICAPILAACGYPTFLLSGRGLAHTGGTLDKLESIPGMQVILEREEIRAGLKATGLVISGQTENIAPADRKLYALRDVTGTVGSVGLICASILSKKIAVKPACLVLDVKSGSGANLIGETQTRRLADTMLGILRELRHPAKALVTNMDRPLGRMVGNALEIRETCAILGGYAGEDVQNVIEISLALAAHAMVLGGKAASYEAAFDKAKGALQSGEAFRKFKAFVAFQGGDVAYLKNPLKLPESSERVVLRCEQEGFVGTMDCRELGRAANLLGAGRLRKEDGVDPAVGLEILKTVGDAVRPGDELVVLHVNDTGFLGVVQDKIRKAYGIVTEAPEKRENIFTVIES